ncbi:MAG: HAD family hydrolase, partial [Gemmatimonadetes bacterium]|nr:HAD family hydrolase [Gemmatimonadota bacterium]
MHPTAIVFDVDGTLIDTYHLYLESYRRALAPVLGYAPSDEEILGHHPVSERGILRGWVGEERVDECHAELCRHYAELHAALAEGFYDGVREMLAALRSAGIPLGVVTSKGRRAWEVTAGHIDLGEFAVVVTEDDVRHPKPEPEGLLAAAAALGIRADQIAYVGDSVGDMQAGRAAGMHVVPRSGRIPRRASASTFWSRLALSRPSGP